MPQLLHNKESLYINFLTQNFEATNCSEERKKELQQAQTRHNK